MKNRLPVEIMIACKAVSLYHKAAYLQKNLGCFNVFCKKYTAYGLGDAVGFPVLLRSHAGFLPENLGKIRLGGEAGTGCNLRDREVGAGQKLFARRKPFVRQITDR